MPPLNRREKPSPPPYIPCGYRFKGGPGKLFTVRRGSANVILNLRGVREKCSGFAEKQLTPPAHIKLPFPKQSTKFCLSK